jgi:hypothetical protein
MVFPCLVLIFLAHPISPVRARNQALGLQGRAHREADRFARLITAQILEVALSGLVTTTEQGTRCGIGKGNGAATCHFNRGEEKNKEECDDG